MRGEARGDVAPQHGIDAPVGEREEIQARLVHRLAPRWIDAEHVQDLVGAQ
jgi:hypothetical protein